VPQVAQGRRAGTGHKSSVGHYWRHTDARAPRTFGGMYGIRPSRFDEHRDAVFTVDCPAAATDRDICAAAGNVTSLENLQIHGPINSDLRRVIAVCTDCGQTFIWASAVIISRYNLRFDKRRRRQRDNPPCTMILFE